MTIEEHSLVCDLTDLSKFSETEKTRCLGDISIRSGTRITVEKMADRLGQTLSSEFL